MNEYVIVPLDAGVPAVRFGDDALARYAARHDCYVGDHQLIDRQTHNARFTVAIGPESVEREAERMVAFANQLREDGWRGAQVRPDAVDLILAHANSFEHLVALANGAFLKANPEEEA